MLIRAMKQMFVCKLVGWLDGSFYFHTACCEIEI